MKIARTIIAVRNQVALWRRQGHTVGFVPTMGALHAGHMALVHRSRQTCDRTVVSVFVNPTQFGPREDFAKYPRAWGTDRDLCEDAGVDLVFAPSVDVMYPDGFTTTVHISDVGNIWEGASRLGHFDGVATVVAKLFTIVGPDAAIFGQKDFQQTVVIRRMVKDLNLPVRVVVAPTLREPGGLAMSSRNAYLDLPTRIDAQSIYRSLKWSERQIRTGVLSIDRLTREMSRMVEAGKKFKVEYIGFCDKETLEQKKTAKAPLVILIAARCLVKGPAYNRRYIDNIVIR